MEEALKQKGHDIAQFAMRSPNNLPSIWSKYFVSTIDYNNADPIYNIRNAFKIIYSMEASQNIKRLISSFRPDISHLHIFQHQLSPSILPVLKYHGIPIIYTAHDLKSICPNYKMLSHNCVCELCKGQDFYHCFFNRCTKNSAAKSLINVIEMYVHNLMSYYDLIDLVITPSSFYRDKLIQYRFPKEKVAHIPNFVDVDKFDPFFVPDSYFLYCGRLSEEKGLITLINSMKNVKSGRLLIAGNGPLENSIQQLVNNLGLKNIELLGFLDKSRLKSLFQKSLFTILPSEWYENGPMSLLESFAYGKPVIGSNIGGIPEHIDDGINGLLFEPKNSDQLAEKINWMMDNKTKSIEMGKAAREKAELQYSKDLHIRKILNIYSSFCRK